MAFLDWFAQRFPNSPLQRVAALEVDADEIRFRRVSGTRGAVRWDGVNRVVIRTTDEGPFIEDVYYLLESADEVIVVPQPASGCDELLDRLQKLPGFDNEAVIAAMACTDNREFLCWQRLPEPQSD
jgi:hypothetical protein